MNNEAFANASQALAVSTDAVAVAVDEYRAAATIAFEQLEAGRMALFQAYEQQVAQAYVPVVTAQANNHQALLALLAVIEGG